MEKRGEQFSFHRDGEQGKACCPAGGDVPVSHEAPHATRWHLNLCLGRLAGTADRARCDTGIPRAVSKLLLAGSSHGKFCPVGWIRRNFRGGMAFGDR